MVSIDGLRQPARPVWEPVFACGALGCLVCGLIGASAFIFATLGELAWSSNFSVIMVPYAVFFGTVFFAPLNIVLLPIAWAFFLRSRRHAKIFYVFGSVGGGLSTTLLSVRLEILPKPLGLAGVGGAFLVGSVAGMTSAFLFKSLLPRQNQDRGTTRDRDGLRIRRGPAV